MKHHLSVSVAKEPKADSIAACRTVTIRERLFHRLFGETKQLMIIVPGDSVQEIAITNIDQSNS